MKSLFKSVCMAALVIVASGGVRADTGGESIYPLAVSLTDQGGMARKLDVYRGQPTLITMFYGSCPNVCPLLIETMQYMERSLSPKQRSELRVLMISIDPDRDTPAALAELAKAHHVDLSHWTLARANTKDVRKIAAVLNIQYRRLPDGNFNHSSVIALLNGEGQIVATTSRLGSLDAEFVTTLTQTLAANESTP